ncbi:hypothetical protein SJC01_24 [Bacteroides phage SJC01]|nr:hypothetical protein SJC01_24 [Bacteroides phage SJC01]
MLTTRPVSKLPDRGASSAGTGGTAPATSSMCLPLANDSANNESAFNSYTLLSLSMLISIFMIYCF